MIFTKTDRFMLKNVINAEELKYKQPIRKNQIDI